jgi:hypothetical protein
MVLTTANTSLENSLALLAFAWSSNPLYDGEACTKAFAVSNIQYPQSFDIRINL